MKDNLNIEELFQDKFNSFESEVSPDAWANIQQGMTAAAGTSAATGMSLLMKGVIAGGIVAATVTSVYLFSDRTGQETTPENNLVVNDQVDNNTNNIVVDQTLQSVDLPDNTINGLNVSVDNFADQTNVEIVVDNSDNGITNNTGGSDPDNTVVINPQTDEGSNNDDSNNVGEQNVGTNTPHWKGPINDPKPGTLDSEPIVKDQISSNPFFDAGDEFAPTVYTFHANAENARSVEWLFEDGTVLNGEDVEFTFEKPGKYVVSMTAYGDGEPVNEMLEIIIKSSSSINTLPNIITPNGDRKNDFFAISTTDIETFEIKITDQQGRLLYENTDPDFRWYGTNLGGEELPPGVYIYSFFAKGFDGTEFKKADQIKIKIE